MDIFCKDGKFTKSQLGFYEQYGVVVPQEGMIYTVRDVIINSNGENGLLLEELINPKVPIKHPIMGVAHLEPNWRVSRFSSLSGGQVNEIEIAREIRLVNAPAIKRLTENYN